MFPHVYTFCYLYHEDWAQQLTTSSFGRQDSGRSFSVYNNTAGSVTSFLIATDDCFPMLDVSVLPNGSKNDPSKTISKIVKTAVMQHY